MIIINLFKLLVLSTKAATNQIKPMVRAIEHRASLAKHEVICWYDQHNN